MNELVNIPANHGTLEGIYEQYSREQAVIITHPHPMYGGDMYNSVVHTISKAFHHLSYSTLRFNFRGVGKSTGSFDNGLGEQEDLKFAIQYLSEQGFNRITLAGYSFGSWVIYNLVIRENITNSIVLISPPVDFIEFKNAQLVESLKMVLVGTRDDFASLENVSRLVPIWNPKARLEIIQGADHFFSGYLEKLEQAISSESRFNI
ncbi:alpha/beta hydrolase [bacterium]|nr:alpha/beta hydrolase [bacterium]